VNKTEVDLLKKIIVEEKQALEKVNNITNMLEEAILAILVDKLKLTESISKVKVIKTKDKEEENSSKKYKSIKTTK
ncbi:762_t:CDS:2, partial [Scutellospora calospora]